ncbi:hypothetical protein TNCV_3400701 [Trichonephila clavipes]|nr:hypothetical protein TNCV_3400701 [Trichonephila clavipes]
MHSIANRIELSSQAAAPRCRCVTCINAHALHHLWGFVWNVRLRRHFLGFYNDAFKNGGLFHSPRAGIEVDYLGPRQEGAELEVNEKDYFAQLSIKYFSSL